MHPGIKLNDGKIYAKGVDGKHSEVVIVDEFIGTASIEPMEGEFTYGNSKVLEDATTTISLPLTHKEWYKKRKGKRWVNYFVTKPGMNPRLWGELLGYYDNYPVYCPHEPVVNLKFGLTKKKPRGKLAKEHRRMYKYTIRHLNDHYVDYTAYCTELKGEE